MPDRSDAPPAADRRWLWWALAAIAPLALVLAGFGLDRALHAGQVLRGIYVDDIEVSGLDAASVRAVVEGRANVLASRALTVAVGARTFDVEPAALAFAIDLDAAEQAALAAGRDGGIGAQLGFWLARFGSDHRIGARCVVDAGKLEPLLADWEQQALEPPFEGAIRVENGQARAEPPRAGRRIDRLQARDAIAAALCSGEPQRLALKVSVVAPERSDTVTAAALEQAKKLLAGPVVLVGELPPEAPEEVAAKSASRAAPPKAPKAPAEEAPPPSQQPFSFAPEVLAPALRSRLTDSGGVEVYFEPEALEPALAEARKALERPPVDARFEIDKGDKIRIVPGRAGRVIAARAVASALLAAAQSATREGVFPVEVGREPALTTEAAEALGIKQLVASFTTTHPCCKPRVKNIHRIADLIDGVLLRPGERFSINEHVGPRTAAKGFLPAPTIVLGEEKDTVGGGVSQFATTFFNAAFHGGLEIVERQPHSYWFRRYPMGHEATLSYPKPDVIIRNDTEAGLLIKTYYTEVSITVKLFGDNGGRKVRKKVSHPQDVTDPPLEYIADPALDPSKTKVKARGAKGWSVMVGRVVTYPDGTEKEEERKVTYKPRVRQLRVHPCRIPKGEEGYTGEQCPEPEEPDDDDADDGGEGGEPAAPDDPGQDSGAEPAAPDDPGQDSGAEPAED